MNGLKLAVIDPVGAKAGMDHYDLLLCSGLQNAGADVILFSNFQVTDSKSPVKRVFFNTGVAKWKAIFSNFTGHIKAFSIAKQNNINWIIVHVFRAGLFDLVVFGIARLMGLRLCTIIHDIESLDTRTLHFVRKLVLHRLPNLRIVHNEFCRKELTALKENRKVPVSVIPHVNFVHLFDKYRQPDTFRTLINKSDTAGNLHPALKQAIKQDKQILLFFGQIKKAKGIEVLLNAAALSKEDFVVVIAGKVRDDNWNNYESSIASLNISSKVIPIIRHISDDERDFLFAVSRAVVLPYTHIYQSGVLLMAMSFPRLVIASDLEPNAALVNHNRNGLLFKSGQAADLAFQMDKVLRNEIDSTRLESQSIQDIRERYSPDVIGTTFVSSIREIDSGRQVP